LSSIVYLSLDDSGISLILLGGLNSLLGWWLRYILAWFWTREVRGRLLGFRDIISKITPDGYAVLSITLWATGCSPILYCFKVHNFVRKGLPALAGRGMRRYLLRVVTIVTSNNKGAF
jgi:hypothetical protein